MSALGFVFVREFEQGVAAFELEFLAAVRAVVFNRALVDSKELGDFAVGLIVSNEVERGRRSRFEVTSVVADSDVQLSYNRL